MNLKFIIMIYITFKHSRDLFKKDLFHSWVYKTFDFNANDLADEKPIKFEGCEYGNHYPTISMHTGTFEEKKDKIPFSSLKKITKIQGVFNTIEQLALGVCNFKNECDNGELANSIVSSSIYDFRNK